MIFRLVFCCILLFMSSVSWGGEANVGSLNGKVIAVVRVAHFSRGLDRRTKRQLDAIVPRLKKLGPDEMLRIEGYAHAGSTRIGRVKSSFALAEDVQRYLVVKHHLHADLYISALDDKISSSETQSVRIVVYPNAFVEEKVELSRSLTDNR